MDRRVRPDRIIAVLAPLKADVIALQEVLVSSSRKRSIDQARLLASELGMNYVLGETRKSGRAPFGNAVLSRAPIGFSRHHDLTVKGYEERGCLRVDIPINGHGLLHIFNVHLGTAYLERRAQARKLMTSGLLRDPVLVGPRIVLGDFNEWTRGLVSRSLAGEFESVDLRHHLRRSRTYPGLLPLMHLDHIYFDSSLELHNLSLVRSRPALLASDHLPLLADFRFNPASDWIGVRR